MGNTWYLMRNAAHVARWMAGKGFSPSSYAGIKWNFPFLIGDPGGEERTWMVVDVAAARQLVIAAGQVVLEDHER